MPERNDDLLPLALDHIDKLLHSSAEPGIPDVLADNEALRRIHEYLSHMRGLLSQYAGGDFSATITDRGVIAGRLKSLQSNLRHMVWQVKQVAEGDFTQRVHFLGEYSDSFNSMVEQLSDALDAMRKKEAELTALSASLQEEIVKRAAAMHALEQREAEFRYLAEHDPLTGVLNRRSFFTLAEMEIGRIALEGRPCCLAMMDVDFFKGFNDEFGHLEGDNALKHVADIGKSSLRQRDIMARFGGEEFIFLFPHCSLEQGKAAAERIRVGVASKPVMVENNWEYPVTVSLGVAELPAKM